MRNLVNIFASKEDMLYQALQVDSNREITYCKKVDKHFVEELNRRKPKDLQTIKRLWCGDDHEYHSHYDSSRYRCLYAHQTIMQSKTLKPHRLVGFRENTQNNFRGSGGTSSDQDYHSSRAKPESVNQVLFFSELSVLLLDLPLHKLV